MAQKLTVSQLNKLGERLRKNLANEDDLRSLDEFRLSFQSAYQQVFEELSRLGLKPGGRPQKTTLSIIAKLNREKTRLSRMQDIAGCRVEVDDLLEQDRVVHDLKAPWPRALIYDRRVKPSSGYRAVHLVIEVDDHLVEIQVRTSLQHSWASATEKLSDMVDSQIKYGGGPEFIQTSFRQLSGAIADFEAVEKDCAEFRLEIGSAAEERFRQFEKKVEAAKAGLIKLCEKLTMHILEEEHQ